MLAEVCPEFREAMPVDARADWVDVAVVFG
jgi:hypothetical protein